MSESEIVKCKQCGNEYDALTQEVASYSCPNCPKTKPKHKVLDSVSIKSLTKLDRSSETQEPNNARLIKNFFQKGIKWQRN